MYAPGFRNQGKDSPRLPSGNLAAAPDKATRQAPGWEAGREELPRAAGNRMSARGLNQEKVLGARQAGPSFLRGCQGLSMTQPPAPPASLPVSPTPFPVPMLCIKY